MSLTLTRRYNVDRFGYLIPHRYGNLPMVGAVATYRPGEGRFGRGAVAVEEENNGSLLYPADFFNQSSFTVAGWMKFHDPSDNLVGTSYRRIFEIGDSVSAGRHFAARRRSATMATFVIPTGNNDSLHLMHCTFRPREDGWIHFAFTRDGVNVRAIINGDVTEDTIDNIAEINPQKLSLGCRLTSGLQMNGLIDELLILPYAASEEEILSWYESQGPLPPHPQALLQWDWQAVTHRRNVDRFGYLIPTQYGNVPMVGAVATYRPGEGRFGGAVAVEEGTTNLIPSGRLKFEGWSANRGAEVTVTQGYGIPGVTPDGATRIQTVGGEATLKYLTGVGRDPGNSASLSVWVYNIGQKTVRVRGNVISGTIDVAPGEIRRCTLSTSNLIDGYRQIRFYALEVNDSLDFIAYQPQIEAKPFATSFVDGTRPDGILAYPIALPENHTIACYRKSHTDEDYRLVVKRSDGKVFVDGVEDSEYDVGWLAGRNLLQDSSLKENSGPFKRNQNVTLSNPDNEFLRVYSNQTVSTPGLIINPYEIPFGTYTLSFDVRGFGGLRQIGIRLYDARTTLNISENFTRVSATLTPTNNSDYSYFLIYLQPTEVGQGFDIRNIKLEKGNKATDWTPAPEDLGYSDDCLMFSNQTGLIDELLVLPYAASEEEIVSWYEAQGPLPPHPQALLQWDRQAVRPAQMVKL